MSPPTQICNLYEYYENVVLLVFQIFIVHIIFFCDWCMNLFCTTRCSSVPASQVPWRISVMSISPSVTSRHISAATRSADSMVNSNRGVCTWPHCTGKDHWKILENTFTNFNKNTNFDKNTALFLNFWKIQIFLKNLSWFFPVQRNLAGLHPLLTQSKQYANIHSEAEGVQNSSHCFIHGTPCTLHFMNLFIALSITKCNNHYLMLVCRWHYRWYWENLHLWEGNKGIQQIRQIIWRGHQETRRYCR